MIEVIVEENEKYKVYRLPILKHKRSKLLSWFENSKLNKVGILFAWMFGHLDTTSLLLDYKLSERKFLKDHLSNYKYDVMLGIFSPHYHLSNCNWAGKKFRVKYVLDFRDLWNNRIIHKKYKPNFTEKVQDSINSYYWKKWAKKASLLTITSSHWAWKLSKVTNKEVKVVFNGFESDGVLESIKTDCFEILHTGSIYNHQEFKVFFEGIRRFVKIKEPQRFKVRFIGAKQGTSEVSLNSVISVDDLKDEVFGLEEYVEFLPRVSHNEVKLRLEQASLLFLPSFPNSPGTFGGKIFEYLNAKVTILIVPNDHDVLDDLIHKTNSGVSKSNADELFEYLSFHYEKWEKGEQVTYAGNLEEILKFSRENQTKKYASLLN